MQNLKISKNYFNCLGLIDRYGSHSDLILSNKGKIVSKPINFKGVGQYGNGSKSFTMSDVLSKFDEPYLNYYITPNTFWNGERNQSNVVGFNANYLDLDIDKVAHVDDSQIKDDASIPSFTVDVRDFMANHYIYKLCKLAKIPVPTFTVCSGHGVHLIWGYNHQVYISSKKMRYIKIDWIRVQHYLSDRLGKACNDLLGFNPVDPKVTNDCARVLRVPNTFNNKPNKPRVKCYQKLTGKFFNFFGLYNLVIKAYKHKKHITRVANQTQTENPSKSKNEPNNNKSSQRLYHYLASSHLYSSDLKHLGFYWKDVLFDIVKLVKIREHNSKSNAHERDESIFLFGNACRHLGYTHSSKFPKSMIMLNNCFANPLSKPNVIKVIKEFTKQQYIYNYKADDMIKLLSISEAEQSKLSVLRDSKVKALKTKAISKKSSAKYYNPSKEQHSKHMRAFHHKVLKLYENGTNKSKIARILHCSRMNIYRIIKHYSND